MFVGWCSYNLQMFELNEYITKNYKKLKDISKKITSEKYDSDDLLHDTILALYDSDKEKIKKLIENNQLLYWIARIMINQYHSKTSPFYKKYRKYYRDKDERFVLNCWNVEYINSTPDRIHRMLDDDGVNKKKQLEKDIERINKKLKEIHWFDSEVFRIYHQMGKNYSLNKMSKDTGINRNTLYASIKKVKKYFKNEL